MEQAAARGIGAVSEREAARRGVPWLDLVRDPKQRAALGTLAAELHRRAFVPEALRALVTRSRRSSAGAPSANSRAPTATGW